MVGYNQASALNKLFNELQTSTTENGDRFYDIMEAFYPMIGTYAAAQGVNGNGNSTYDLQFAGGWLFNSMGMKGNGINSNVFVARLYEGGTNDLLNTHFSIYGTLASEPSSNRGDLTLIGPDDSNMAARIALNARSDNNGIYEYGFNTGSPEVGASNDFVVISSDGNNTHRRKNGVSLGNGGGTTNTPYDHYPNLGMSKVSDNFQISLNRYGWASFGGYMTQVDMGVYQGIVNNYMTTIGRNSY